MNSCQRSIVNYKKRITGYTPLQTGVKNTVLAIYALDAEHVYIGGNFTNVNNDNNSRYITMWNGTTGTYTALGTGLLELGSSVKAIYALDPSNVYIGGSFLSAGGDTKSKNITRWDGTKFNALGTGVNSTVNAIYALNPLNVYIGGNFTGSRITKWNGTTYTAISGFNGEVNAIHGFDAEHIYIGGSFTSVGSNIINNIIMLNGTTGAYTTLGVGVNASVRKIYALDEQHVYIVTASFVTMLSGTTTYTQILNSEALSIYALDSQHVYIGGSFVIINLSNSIIMWNGTSLIPLQNGVQSRASVNAIYALDPQHVYIGGSFSSVNSNGANKYVTMWSGE